MAFFDDVKKLGKNVADKGKDLVEVTKLNSQIGTEQGKINEIFGRIGAQVYENYKAGNDSGFGEFCAQVAELEAKINELRQKVMEIKDSAKCPNCGAEVAKDVAFCPKCGTKMTP